MSNHPNNFSPEHEFPAEINIIGNAQEAYREIVESAIIILKRRGLTGLGRKDINWLSFLDIDELLSDYIHEELSRLEDAGYSYSVKGDDYSEFYDRMYALLREKEVRPVTTNPATTQTVAVRCGDAVQFVEVV